ncbi:MAG: type II secretion system major pseudopilin GspG [Steroidobacteraceae bacterium]
MIRRQQCFDARGRRQVGFTLIEIMVVVVIIGLLAAIIVPNVIGKVDEARVSKAQADLRQIETALTMFRLDTSRYPTSEQGLKILTKAPADGSVRNYRAEGYLPRLPKDPWQNDYHYTFPGTHGQAYDLYSLGADGQEGGEGADTDIGNWNLEEQ